VSPTSLRPLTDEERAARGFCTCPHRAKGSRATDENSVEPCQIHPDGSDLGEAERIAAALVFFDDRRERFVTWADAVEAMRQDRHIGNPGLVQFTWMNLMGLLAALRDPKSPAIPSSQDEADDLVAWAGDSLDYEELRWLLVFARGGGSTALTKLLRFVAHQASN